MAEQLREQSDAEKLEEIRQRWAKATPGPWGFGGNGVATAYGSECIAVTTFPKQYDLMTDIKRTRANGEAIAAAPTDIAWLIALASRAVEADQRLEEAARSIRRSKRVTGQGISKVIWDD